MKLSQLYRDKKKKERQKREEQQEKEQQERFELNKFFASKMMANRGHDEQRGTAGHVMGDPSPGRSF